MIAVVERRRDPQEFDGPADTVEVRRIAEPRVSMVTSSGTARPASR